MTSTGQLYSILREGHAQGAIHAGAMTPEREALLRAETERANAGVFKAYGGGSSEGDNSRAYMVWGNVAVIPMVGPISRYPTIDWVAWKWTRGTAAIAGDVMQAENDPNVKAILLWVDSPGGTVDGTEELANTIWNTKKPVHALVAGTCASAAYWVASQCDKIWSVAETNRIGSIGVIRTHVDYTGYFELAGMKVTYITSPNTPDKIVGADNAPLSAEDLAKMEAELKEIKNAFTITVNRGRKNAGATVAEEAFTGAVFQGRQARALGLIDGVKSGLNFVMDEVTKAGNAAAKAANANKADTKMGLFDKFFGGSESAEEKEQKLQELANASKQADAMIAKLEGQTANLKVTVGTLETANAELTSKVEAANTELAKVQGELAAKAAEKEALSAELDAAKETNTALEAAKTALEAEKATMTGELETAKAAVKTANDELAKRGGRANGGRDASDTNKDERAAATDLATELKRRNGLI